MILKILPPKKSLNKAYLKAKPHRSEIEQFKNHLLTLLDRINPAETEEFHKNLVIDFLNSTYYKPDYFINTKGRNDLMIHNGKSAKTTVGVIIEAKSPINKSEMITTENLNRKAFQELVLYYLRERITHKNLEIKYLVATNINEWFIFNATIFDRLFAQNKSFVKQFKDFEENRLAETKTDFFYSQIAAPFIENITTEIEFAYFDFQDYQKPLRNNDPTDDRKLISLYKILSPEHLLKLSFANDSNSLDKGFYNEFLHILGLHEKKEGGKKVIERYPVGQRAPGSFIENTIYKLEGHDILNHLKDRKQYGDNAEDQLFHLALELCIVWMNRILFLKLLEAQLLSYHRGNSDYAFLHIKKIPDFDELDALFFQVLARKTEDRKDNVKEKFEKVPYLNSSLFEIEKSEHQGIYIGNLDDDKTLPIFGQTVLKENDGKKSKGEITPLRYLFRFLNAYDFSSEGSEDIQEENKTLINASVLGLIFEKINGYKDGSFFTPGFITMYMARETVRKTVLQKFKEAKGWNCENLKPDLYNKIEDIKEANTIVNSIKICDPAVGSGHFLVSVLNEMIAVKSELGLLMDQQGNRLKNYDVVVSNDELVITDEDGEPFEYHPNNTESQRVQETLFNEKKTIIENCLFGVDINPNSVKICRLRLWIELLKNAYYVRTDNDPSLQTLPNIDINIKCGNSLISRFDLHSDLKTALKNSKWTIDSYRNAVTTYRNAHSKDEKHEMARLIQEIKSDFETTISLNDSRRKQLEKWRGELFHLTQETLFERTAQQKKAWEKQVKGLTQKIQKIETELDEIKNNRIYENAFEWRFEFPEVLNDEGDFIGFDAVIANPPYGALFSENEKAFIKSNFQYCDYQFDIYMTFFERSYNLLKDFSQLCFIVPNTWLLNLKTPNIRKLLFSHFNTHNVRAYNFPVFEEAVVDTIIVSAEKRNDLSGSMAVQIIDKNGNTIENQFSKNELAINYQGHVNIYLSDFASKIEFKFSGLSKLDNVAKITQGTKPFQKGKGKPKQDEKTMQEKPFVQTYKKDDTFRPLLRGSLINKYVITWNDDYYISLGDWLAEPRYSANYDAPFKIVIRQTGSSLMATIDDREFVVRDNLYTIISTNKEYSEHLILACLNSKLLNWYYQNIVNNEVGEALAQVKRGHLEILPMPKYNKAIFETVVSLTQQILEIKQANNSAVTTALEAEIDRLVYELYELTEEEIAIIENPIK